MFRKGHDCEGQRRADTRGARGSEADECRMQRRQQTHRLALARRQKGLPDRAERESKVAPIRRAQYCTYGLPAERAPGPS